MKVRTASILAAAMAVSALVMVPGAAHADPTPPCYGDSCTGKDPQSMGCAGDNAYSVASFTWGTVTVILRYSDWCHANWAVASNPGQTGADFYVENASNEAQYASVNQNNGYYAWTSMVDGTVLARACLFQGLSSPCTGWN